MFQNANNSKYMNGKETLTNATKPRIHIYFSMKNIGIILHQIRKKGANMSVNIDELPI